MQVSSTTEALQDATPSHTDPPFRQSLQKTLKHGRKWKKARQARTKTGGAGGVEGTEETQ